MRFIALLDNNRIMNESIGEQTYACTVEEHPTVYVSGGHCITIARNYIFLEYGK